MNIRITLTVDECIRKVNEATLKFFGFLKHFEKILTFSIIQNYEQACPRKWLTNLVDGVQPPEEYKVIVHSKLVSFSETC